MSVVYVLLAPDGHRKVGYASKLDRRVGQIQPALPWPVELELTFWHPEANKIERTVHKILADARARSGEWFCCSLDRIKHALSMASRIAEQSNVVEMLAPMPPKDVKTMGEGLRLRLTRLALGYNSSKDFGKELGVSFGALSNYELDRREIPRCLLGGLKRQFGVTTDWILFGDDRQLSDHLRASISEVLDKPNWHVSHRGPSAKGLAA